MMTHTDLTFERLLDWLEGRLSAEDALQIEQLLTTADSETQAQVKWLRSFKSVSRAVTFTAPPAALHEKLRQSFQSYAQKQTQQKPEGGFFQRILAALNFDSALQPAMNGLRSADSDRVRQLLYTTEQADVALHVHQHPQDQRVDLSGQVLPNADGLQSDEFCVQLLRDSVEIGIVMADDLGEFSFEAVEPGQYELILSTETSEIALPIFELKS